MGINGPQVLIKLPIEAMVVLNVKGAPMET